MTAKDEGWHVGASIFVHERGYRSETYSATVTKVGRKWVEFQRDGRTWRAKDDRFDIETMRLDSCGAAWGRVYLDEMEYMQDVETEKAWTALVRSLPHRAPDHMTLASIAQVEALILGDKL